MKNTVGQRLKWLLDSNNISSREFQQYVSVGEKQISNWLSGISHIQVKHIVEIANCFNGLSMDWFLLGRGEPFIEGKTNATPDNTGTSDCKCKVCEKLKIHLDLLREECDRKDKAIAELNQQLGAVMKRTARKKAPSKISS